MNDDEDVKINYRNTKIEALERVLGKEGIDKIMQRLGVYMVSDIQRSFRTQERDGEKWKGRRVPNIPGILRDLEQGPNVKARRFQDRPALIDTGELMRRIAWRRIGLRHIKVGSNKPYARKMQDGSRTTVEITTTARKNLGEYLGKKKNADKRAMLSWLFNQKGKGGIPRREIVITTAPRPFATITKDNVKRVKVEVMRAVKEV